MSTADSLQRYYQQVEAELTGNILPFYLKRAVDEQNGGFYGLITRNLTVHHHAPKGLIQNSRILWAFAHAYRHIPNAEYLQMADRAYGYLLEKFWDGEFGGLHWFLNAAGEPVDATKMGYGQAFGIYALVEYFLATRKQATLDKALALFNLVEHHLADPANGGYLEAGQRDWSPYHGDSVDHNPAAKTMNTHLHLLEAYTNLARAGDNAEVQSKLRALITLTLNRLIDPATGHFKMHFTANWQSLNDHVSYGHDIEGSWLLVEAAEVLGDANLLAQARQTALKMAEATLCEGVDADGSLFYEGDPAGITNPNKDWWPQAEAMVGFLNAWQLSGDSRYLEASLKAWQFIQEQIIDRQYEEWRWGVTRQGEPTSTEKTGPWKGPYHNGRACLEVMRRIEEIQTEQAL